MAHEWRTTRRTHAPVESTAARVVHPLRLLQRARPHPRPLPLPQVGSVRSGVVGSTLTTPVPFC
jgi:hypothetical protein